MANIDIQLLVKSFGLGVYETQIVPVELMVESPDSNDGTPDLFEQFVKIKIKELGLGNLQGIIPNNHDVGSFFVFCDRGHEPSKYEISMMGDRIDLLKQKTRGNFKNRVEKLEEYYVQIRQR